MESNQSILKALEIKLKFLESENQNLSSKIEENNKEINRIKSLITSITDNNSLTSGGTMPIIIDDKIVNLKFGWKIHAQITNDLKTVKKVAGG